MSDPTLTVDDLVSDRELGDEPFRRSCQLKGCDNLATVEAMAVTSDEYLTAEVCAVCADVVTFFAGLMVVRDV
jgi:hypothetical protein